MSTSISTAFTGARSSGALRPVHDLVLLVARVGLGVLMIGHAWLMFAFGGYSLGGVGALFAQIGVPLPTLAGPETVIAIGLLGLVLAVTGSGRFGLDHLVLQRRRPGTGA